MKKIICILVCAAALTGMYSQEPSNLPAGEHISKIAQRVFTEIYPDNELIKVEPDSDFTYSKRQIETETGSYYIPTMYQGVWVYFKGYVPFEVRKCRIFIHYDKLDGVWIYNGTSGGYDWKLHKKGTIPELPAAPEKSHIYEALKK